MSSTSALSIARSLVGIPSVNPAYEPHGRGERDVASWIAEWGRSHGIETVTQPVLDGRDNVVLRIRNGADHPHLLFNGHMDTVGVEGMTIPPFAPRVHDGRLAGRGAADMKGPLAAMLAAAARLDGDRGGWRGTLTVGCVVDEEFHYRGILALLDGYVPPDFAVVGEPTSLRVVRGCKGCLRFAIVARGRAAHSSRPELGKNAIVAMAGAVSALERFFHGPLADHRSEHFGPCTGSIGLIEGGSGINVVPENCRIQVDVRLLPDQHPIETHAEIEAAVRRALPEDAGIEWVFEPPLLTDQGYELPAESELVRRACAVAGSSPEVAFFSCDASKIAARGVPCIVLGPGDIAAAHTADESIAVDDLDVAADLYTRIAISLMPPTGGKGTVA